LVQHSGQFVDRGGHHSPAGRASSTTAPHPSSWVRSTPLSRRSRDDERSARRSTDGPRSGRTLRAVCRMRPACPVRSRDAASGSDSAVPCRPRLHRVPHPGPRRRSTSRSRRRRQKPGRDVGVTRPRPQRRRRLTGSVEPVIIELPTLRSPRGGPFLLAEGAPMVLASHKRAMFAAAMVAPSVAGAALVSSRGLQRPVRRLIRSPPGRSTSPSAIPAARWGGSMA
jgi:hypothetical protein